MAAVVEWCRTGADEILVWEESYELEKVDMHTQVSLSVLLTRVAGIRLRYGVAEWERSVNKKEASCQSWGGGRAVPDPPASLYLVLQGECSNTYLYICRRMHVLPFPLWSTLERGGVFMSNLGVG
jgi:hypothetical protein